MKKIIKLKSIFYLFLIFNFLLASFPMSALAYPAYIQDSANLAVAGPYDQATAGVANWGTDMEDGSASLSYDYLTAGRIYRIRQTGTISRIRIYTASTTNITGFYLKIWRQGTGTNPYTLVGTSENLASQLVDNNFATIDLSSPITGVQEGDFYGYRIETSSRGKNFYAKSTNNNSGTFFTTNDTGSSFYWENPSPGISLKNYVLPIELYMTAPQAVFIGDSIIAGHTAHYSYVDDIISPLNNATSTIGWQFKNLTGYSYQNMGISSGQTTTVIANRFTKDVINLKPKIVVIEGGVNDLAGNATQETFITNWTNMLNAAQDSSDIEAVIVLKILPWTNGTTTKMQMRDTWNTALETLVADPKYTKAIIVDAGPYVGKFREGGDPGNFWDIKFEANNDIPKMHFNQTGHAEIARVIADHLPKPTATFDNDFLTWNKGNITVNYNLIQTGGNTNLNIFQTATSGIEYSTDNISWHDATKGVGGDSMTGLTASATPGINHSFVWDSTSNLPNTEDSSVYLRIRPNGATAWATSTSFGIDNVAPSSVSDNVPATWQANNVTITLTCTDGGSGCDKVYYTLDGSDPTTASSKVDANNSWQFTYSTEATSTLKYRGEDKLGNLGNVVTAANQLQLDKTVPTIDAGANQSQSSVFTQTATASDSGSGLDTTSYQWAQVSGPGTITFGTADTLSTTIEADRDGDYVISFTADDNAGNSASANFTLTWTNPVIPPTPTPSIGGGSSISFSDPIIPTGGFTASINNGSAVANIDDDAIIVPNRNVTLEFNAGDDIKRMAISMAGDFTDASQEDYTPVKQWDLCSQFGGASKSKDCPDGKYTVYVKFYTAHGRSSAAATVRKNIILKSEIKEEVKKEEGLKSALADFKLFTKYLKRGQIDFDVKRLQIFLNMDPDTRVANTDAGSPGKETNYFGALTYEAVIRFQEKYAPDVLVPWGLTKGTGYAAKTTINKINELLRK